jgi:hypothetical protein
MDYSTHVFTYDIALTLFLLPYLCVTLDSQSVFIRARIVRIRVPDDSMESDSEMYW